jgi:drug/metabolite transporter (DMT)-like permease
MGFKYNLLSGFFAGLAGVLTKFGFNFDPEGPISSQIMPHLANFKIPYLTVVLHALFIVMMFLSNALMLKFYVKSMHENGAAKATVYNFAINYLSSLILGTIFFNEIISTRLILGVSLILSGTALISTVQ